MLKPISLPRVNNILIFAILICVILYFGREFFVLIMFSGFLAMLMTPLSNKLEQRHIKRAASAIVSVLIIVGIILLLLILLSAQIMSMAQEIPKIRYEVSDLISSVQQWISNELKVNVEQQVNTLKDHASDAIGTASGFLAGVVKGSFSFVGKAFVVLIFTFLFLLHREKYENFIVMLYDAEKRTEAREVIDKVSRISEQYLVGRMLAIFIIAVLNIIGFLVIGLKNGILLASIAALMAIIPYVGPLIGGIVPFIMAFIEGSFSQAFEVIIVVLIVSMFDHYFIEPYIVGGSVNISPFFAILVLIAGYLFWGISGVILFLPLLGILKIVCENVEGLHPYAYLIGDQEDSSSQESIVAKLKSIFGKKKN